jgi:DNA-directed RNA polymerase I subunit RPA1
MKRESEGERAPKTRYQAIKGETFKKMYYLKYMKSVAHPGENVGTIAGQSIGEPST